jgi:formate dehydrogenase subunit gamma
VGFYPAGQESAEKKWGQQLIIIAGNMGFVVIFAFFFVHLYLGTIGSSGSVSATISGWVTRAWLKKQNPNWLKEMEHEGKLAIYGGKK